MLLSLPDHTDIVALQHDRDTRNLSLSLLGDMLAEDEAGGSKMTETPCGVQGVQTLWRWAAPQATTVLLGRRALTLLLLKAKTWRSPSGVASCESGLSVAKEDRLRLPWLYGLSLAKARSQLSADVGIASARGMEYDGAEREAYTFSALVTSPGIPIPPEMAQRTATIYQQASMGRNQDRLSAWSSEIQFRGRSHLTAPATTKLQTMETAAVPGRAVPRLRRLTHATFPLVRGSTWIRGCGQDLRIMDEPSRPRHTVPSLEAERKRGTNIVYVNHISNNESASFKKPKKTLLNRHFAR